MNGTHAFPLTSHTICDPHMMILHEPPMPSFSLESWTRHVDGERLAHLQKFSPRAMDDRFARGVKEEM